MNIIIMNMEKNVKYLLFKIKITLFFKQKIYTFFSFIFLYTYN